MAAETTVGKYRLIAELAHGGMSDVFLAVTEGLSALQFEKLVVIKRLRESVADDPEFVSMLIDEARIAARLNHPNVLQTIEVGEADGRIFLAMEYLDGQPLHRIRARAHGTLPLAIHCSILCDVLAGLDYAHELKDYDGSALNIVHRDATPHNIFVTYDGVVKVVDFGIAKAVGRISQTRHGVVKGKVPYMAPEQARSALLDRRADVFAVGVMLWEAATNKRLWEGTTELQVVTKLARGQVRTSPREVDPSLPETLDRICRRALAPDPADRYPTAGDFERDLEAFLGKELERVPKRDIGKRIAELFADKRELAKQVIETQLSDLRSQRKVSVVSIAPQIHVSGETPVTDEAEFAATELVPSQRTPRTTSDPPAREPRVRSKPPPPARSSLRFIVLLVLGLLALGALIFGISMRASWQPAPSPTTSVAVTLRATPLETRFSIDEGPEQDNPFVSMFPKDGQKHNVRARAPGFLSKTEVVVFDQDVSIRFALAHGTDEGGAH